MIKNFGLTDVVSDLNNFRASYHPLDYDRTPPNTTIPIPGRETLSQAESISE